MKKKKNKQDDYIKAARKGSREAEIEFYGHPLNHRRVHKSKKIYDRKRFKAGSDDLPFLFSGMDRIEVSFSMKDLVVQLLENRRIVRATCGRPPFI